MKKPSIGSRILSFLSKVIVVAILMVAIGFGSYQGVTYYLTGKFSDVKEDLKANKDDKQSDTKEEAVEEVKNEDVESTLLFVEGEDGIHTYIILSLLNLNTNAMDFVLIPENAQVQVGKDIQKKLSKKMKDISGTVEFRDIERIFPDEKYELLSDIISEITGNNIDGWDHMTAENAIAFIDSKKAVSINLTDDFSYRDVNGVLQVIEKGEQSLDGQQAMAYMTYLNGSSSEESDRLGRSEEFLQKFLSGIVSKKKAKKTVEGYQKCVDSSDKRSFDNLTNALKKINSTDYFTLRVLQGSEKDDIFVIDSQKAQLQVSTLMKQAASYSESDKLGKDADDESKTYEFDEDAGDSKNLSIEIYNSALVPGIAGAWRDYLEAQGYNITIVDNYQDEGALSTTRIVVNKEGIGGDLQEFFPGAEFSVGNISTGGDIQIYVGTDSTNVGEN